MLHAQFQDVNARFETLAPRFLSLILISIFLSTLLPALPAMALTPVSAPAFVVGRGTQTISLAITIPATTGSPSFTVKAYSSSDSYTAVIFTRTGYSSGTDLYDSTSPSCNATPILCYSLRLQRTLKFTLTPEPSTGYSSNGEGEKSQAYGLLSSNVVASFGPITYGPVTGFNLTMNSLNSNPQTGYVTVRAFSSVDSYTAISDTVSVLNSGTQAASFNSADGVSLYKFDCRSEQVTAGGVTWLTSDWAGKTTFGYLVSKKPDPPRNVSVTTVTSGTIQVSWDAAIGPYQDYRVYSSTNGVTKSYVGATTGTSFTMSGLTNGTAYYAFVINSGTGQYARSSEYVLSSSSATPASIPGPVDSFSLGNSFSGSSSNVLKLNWTPPTVTGGSPITSYLINFSTSPATWTDTLTALATETSTVVTGLNFGSTYYFRIAPVSSQGVGIFSSPLPFLLVGMASSIAKPASAITSTSAVIAIEVTAQGELTTPTLTYGPTGGATTTISFLPRSSGTIIETATITGLIPGISYSIVSNTSPGVSNDVNGQAVTFTTTPNPISTFMTVPTKNSVEVSWISQDSGPGSALNYTAWAELGGVSVGNGCTLNTTDHNGRTYCNITGLSAGTEYLINVTTTIRLGQTGNGTSIPYSAQVSTSVANATLVLSLSGNSKSAAYRTSTLVTATANISGKVTFYANGKSVPGCKNLSITFTLSCTWKPSVHGVVTLTALLNPTDVSYSNVRSSTLNIGIGRRTQNR